MDDQELINELTKKTEDLIDSYGNTLPAYVVGNVLVSKATLLLLYCAPNEFDALRVVLKAIETGMSNYKIDPNWRIL
jgi:hypothetical protein